MRYANEIIINLPRAEVIRVFDNSENLFKWQKGLKSLDHLEGKYGEEGSISRMVYAGRKSDLVITETITKRNFPDEYSVTCKSKGVDNKVINYFSESEPGHTHWRIINWFTFKGMMALMSPFLKSAFTSNTQLNMERFKVFAEQKLIKQPK